MADHVVADAMSCLRTIDAWCVYLEYISEIGVDELPAGWLAGCYEELRHWVAELGLFVEDGGLGQRGLIPGWSE